MKILPFKIPKPRNEALIFVVDKGVSFYDKLHQHEEIQISYIVEGEGTLFVGDTVNYYKAGDIFAIGSNLPHVFKSDSIAGRESEKMNLFFSKNSFGDVFFGLDEMSELSAFFKHVAYGFKPTSHLDLLIENFNLLAHASKFEQFVITLQILKLTASSNYKSLSSYIYNKKYNEVESKRLQDVFDFTINHFEEDITLIKIAAIANMTQNAFCKYFKKRTNKTYFRFLNELRIESACKLLSESNEINIADIAYRCGFGNVSNFNRQFKIIKNTTPNVFKKSIIAL